VTFNGNHSSISLGFPDIYFSPLVVIQPAWRVGSSSSMGFSIIVV